MGRLRERGQRSGEQLIEELVLHITRWGLAQPAIMLLEVTKPLSFVVSQGLLLWEPIFSLFYVEPQIAGYANLLADRSNVEDLITRLEESQPMCDSTGEERG